MLREVEAFIRQFHMIDPGDVVIVGVSGGADSVCLLSVLRELGQSLGCSLRAVHIQHGIRGAESLSDAAFVEKLCASWGIPLERFDYDVPAYAAARGMSEEEAGRTLRYRAFEEAADRWEALVRKEKGTSLARARIAVAHNSNDQAETILFQLARGSSVAGMAGIPPVRGRIIRPLLHTGREEIEAYLAERELPYRTDSTNLTLEYSRNRLRHQVLPVLREINPRAVEHMCRTAEDIRELSDYLESETERLMECRVEFAPAPPEGPENRDPSAEGGAGAWDVPAESCRIRVEGCAQLPAVLRRRMLHECICRVSGGSRDVTRRHVEAVEGLLDGQSGRRVELPGGVRAYREYGTVRIVREERSGETEEAVLLAEHPDFSVRVLPRSELSREISKKKYTKWFDYDRIKDNLFVRTRREGDYLVLDEAGNTQRLRRYFMNEKIPGALRDEIPLVAEGSHILWVVGGRISAYYKVAARTERVLEIIYHGGREDDE